MDLAPTKSYIKFVLASMLFLFPFYAHAASMYISPAEKSVSVGQTFTLSAYVSSPDQAMNAASGDISFPSNKLQVLAISKANSVMNLWIRDPSFTNSVDGGDVHFEGVVLNPGFMGVAGNLITVTFQAVGVGDAPITFTSGAVLANDGNGTNILNNLAAGDVTIGPRAIAPVAPASPAQTASSSATSTTSTASSSLVGAGSSTLNSTTSLATTTATTTAPPVVVGYIPSSNKWNNLFMVVTEWGLLALLGLILLAAIVFSAIYLVHRMRKWRVSSSRDLLALEEALRNDLKRIEKELGAEKRGKDDPVRKGIERIESDIKKDISLIDDIKKK